MTILLTLTGCESINGYLYRDYKKKDEVQKEIKELEDKYRADVEVKTKDIQTKLEGAIQKQESQIQEGVNKLYAADETFRFYKEPNRLDLMVNHRVNEAWRALGKFPTYEAMKIENERIKIERDETLTSLAELQAKHDKIMAENKKLADDTEKAKKDIDVAKSALAAANQKYVKDSNALQGKLNNVNSEIIKKEQEANSNKASIERMKTKLMIGCGVAAALCIFGTLYSPVGKGSLAIGAAIFGGAAAAIPFIEGWMILVGALVVAAIITIIFLYNHHVADKTADNLINHIEDIKNDSNIPPAVKQIIKTSLIGWNAKYVNDKTQTDHSVEKYIESKLKNHGRL